MGALLPASLAERALNCCASDSDNSANAPQTGVMMLLARTIDVGTVHPRHATLQQYPLTQPHGNADSDDLTHEFGAKWAFLGPSTRSEWCVSLSGSLCGWIAGSHTMGLGGLPFRVLVWVDWSVSTGGHCQSGRHGPCGGGLEPFYVGVNLDQLSGALCRWVGDFGVLTRELVKVCVIGLVSLGPWSVALFSFSGLCEPRISISTRLPPSHQR